MEPLCSTLQRCPSAQQLNDVKGTARVVEPGMRSSSAHVAILCAVGDQATGDTLTITQSGISCYQVYVTFGLSAAQFQSQNKVRAPLSQQTWIPRAQTTLFLH